MKVGIRVDGGFKIGLGHIYKSVWLAEALRKKDHSPVFLVSEDRASLSLIEQKGFPVHLLPARLDDGEKVQELNRWVRTNSPRLLVMDHWDWPEEYWELLERPSGVLMVGVDAPAQRLGRFDLAFQGIRNSLENSERTVDGCRVMEGPNYLMTCPDFRPYVNSWKPPQKLRNILLTFGGTDVSGFSLKMLEFFQGYPQRFNLTLVLGPGSNLLDAVNERLKGSDLSVEVMENLPCLPEHIRASDLVICAAGAGTLSELALTGAPGIAFAVVPNQRDNLRNFSRAGGVLGCEGSWDESKKQLAWHLDAIINEPLALGRLSEKWNGLVDGRGIERMVSILEQHARS